MALSPDNSEAFAREVDENLRRDQIRDAARRHGKWGIAAIVLFLAAVAGYLYWQERQEQANEADSEALQLVIEDIGNGKTGDVSQRLDALADGGSDATRASAALAKAALALQQGDRAQAGQIYARLASDDGLPQAYRDLATLRSVTLDFDQLDPKTVIEKLEPLAKPGEPFFGSAGEITAMAMLKAGRKSEAAKLFAAIAADKGAPASIRDRSAQIAGTLGVDASASIPAGLGQ